MELTVFRKHRTGSIGHLWNPVEAGHFKNSQFEFFSHRHFPCPSDAISFHNVQGDGIPAIAGTSCYYEHSKI